MVIRTLKIKGMSCGHCAMSVRAALSKITNVKEVGLGSAVVELDDQKVKSEDLRAAVANAGYEVVEIA